MSATQVEGIDRPLRCVLKGQAKLCYLELKSHHPTAGSEVDDLKCLINGRSLRELSEDSRIILLSFDNKLCILAFTGNFVFVDFVANMRSMEVSIYRITITNLTSRPDFGKRLWALLLAGPELVAIMLLTEEPLALSSDGSIFRLDEEWPAGGRPGSSTSVPRSDRPVRGAVPIQVGGFDASDAGDDIYPLLAYDADGHGPAATVAHSGLGIVVHGIPEHRCGGDPDELLWPATAHGDQGELVTR